jgi:radical SAM protein with 4Fe4S-binding SPASM domain
MKGVDHEQIVDNVRQLLDIRAKMKRNAPSVNVVFHSMAENLHELHTFRRFWQGTVDHVRVFPISRSFADLPDNLTDDMYRSETCTFVWNRMTVFWNGDVTRCMADVDARHVVGNLGERTIDRIWNGDELIELRSRHAAPTDFRDLGICGRCDW